MPSASRSTRLFDRTSLFAYIGVGAAIAFIAAMTFGAIDAPSQGGSAVGDSGVSQAMHLVSVDTSEDRTRIR